MGYTILNYAELSIVSRELRITKKIKEMPVPKVTVTFFFTRRLCILGQTQLFLQ